jgi:hypothetical protein
MQRQWTRVAGLACLAGLIVVLPAWAMMAAPAPLPGRVARGDVVVIGKVVAIEDRTVSIEPNKGAKDKVQYAVAVIEVSDGLIGAKAKSKVRLGYLPPPGPEPGKPGGPVIFRKWRSYVPTVGTEACFILTKHPVGDFYQVGLFDVIGKDAKELDEVKRCAKLLADPDAGLKSEKADDRLLTAKMLLGRYRSVPFGSGPTKSEPIDATESKRILEALSAADWSKPDMMIYFYQLGLKADDGWTQPKDPKEISVAAQKWLKNNAGKYRIQRLVPEKTDKK